MIAKGYVTVEQADVIFGTPENPASWETVLNNCNHWANLWLRAQGRTTPEGIPTGPTPDFHVVFQAWHRLYLTSFELVVRQVLINEKAANPSRFLSSANARLGDVDVEHWALPYWDYRNPDTGAIPLAFRGPELEPGIPNPLHQPALYEVLRGTAINAGVSTGDLPMPEADLGIVPVAGNSERGVSVASYYNQSVVLQQSQSIFTSFNSYSELSPHAVAHDVIGGMNDSDADKLPRWIAMVHRANAAFASFGETNFWESRNTLNTTVPNTSTTYLEKLTAAGQSLPSELQAHLNTPFLEIAETQPDAFLEIAPAILPYFGNGGIAPSLMGWVPTAGQDPVFFIHHSYVDKLWSEYNQLPTASYLTEDILDLTGWNFTFWQPGLDGEPVLKTYSTWQDATYQGAGVENISSSRAIAALYYPSYRYDTVQPLNIDRQAITEKANSFLALLEAPTFSPQLTTVEPVANTVTELAFRSLDLELPIDAGVVNRFSSQDSNDIQVALELVVNTPMSASENLGVIVGDVEFLTQNKNRIQQYWDSWQATAGTGGRDGLFLPGDNWGLVDLTHEELSRADSMHVMGTLQLARFNPLAMSSPGVMPGMVMTTHYSTNLSSSVVEQFRSQIDIIRDNSTLGIMVVSETPDSVASQFTTISAISASLHQNLYGSSQAAEFDAMAYLTRNIEQLATNEVALSDLANWFFTHDDDPSDPPTFYSRATDLAFVYLASNPSLIREYRANPLGALQHYLTSGMQDALSLDGWLRSDAASFPGEGSAFEKARAFVLSQMG